MKYLEEGAATTPWIARFYASTKRNEVRKIEKRGYFKVDCPNGVADVSGRVLRVKIFADSKKCEKAEAESDKCEIENCLYNKGKKTRN